MPSLHSSLYITLLLTFPPLSSAFSPVDGKTNKKQRAATVAIAAAGLSSLDDGSDISSSRVHSNSHYARGRSSGGSFRGSLSNSGHDVDGNIIDSSMDDFARRLQLEQSSHANSNNNDDTSKSTPSTSKSPTDDSSIQARRHFLSTMLATTTSALLTSSPAKASAYQQAYPIELTSTPYGTTETSANSLSKLQQERLSNKKAKVAQTQNELLNDPLGLQQLLNNSRTLGLTVSGATLWGLALWLVTGSRSNPLVTPVANLLYNAQDEEWLRDRNDGYFGDLPIGLMVILSALFVCLGVILDRAVYFLAEGDAAVSLQLAGVSVIGGAVWEVGRLAAKEKAPTREDYERDVVLYQEFDEFATKRLIVGKGSCHRSEVIAAFRRYNPKYRVAESEEYPLADIEIERILRQWNRQFGSRSEMSSAGFFAGISIDGAADAFAPR